jgi:hypothetical protein
VRERSADRNRVRWPVKAFWHFVQSVGSALSMRTGISCIAQQRPQYLALKQQVWGLMKTMVALDINSMNSESLALKREDAVYSSIKGDLEFKEETRERAAKLACMSIPWLERF